MNGDRVPIFACDKHFGEAYAKQQDILLRERWKVQYGMMTFGPGILFVDKATA